MGVLGGRCIPAQRMCGDQRASPASVLRSSTFGLTQGRSLPWNFTFRPGSWPGSFQLSAYHCFSSQHRWD